MGPSFRQLFFAAAAIAGLVTFLSADVGTSPAAVLASHAGGADAFLIDMDPSGNTATTVGEIQDCARINKNGVQDADEDAVDTVFADIVALNIPVSHPLVGFEVNVRHDTSIVIDDGDFSQMLASNAGSGPFFTDIFQTGPDTTVLRAVDFAPPLAATAEVGSGVLVRIRFNALSGGTALVPVTLFGSAHLDPNNDSFIPDNSFNAGLASEPHYWQLPSSRIAIDQPCPPPLAPTDVVITNVQVLAPASVYASEPFQTQTVATLRNLGPSTVSAYIVGGRPGAGCAYVAGGGVYVTGPPIPPGDSVTIGSTYLMSCDVPGPQTFPVAYAAAIVLDATDTNLTNNLHEALPVSMNVLANDSDGDGVQGSVDLCPDTPAGLPVDGNGCSLAQVDSDGDGLCDPGAPSNGPAPGCVRSVAVGGVMGLLDEGSTSRKSAGSAGADGADGARQAIAAAGIVLATVALAGVGLRRRQRR